MKKFYLTAAVLISAAIAAFPAVSLESARVALSLCINTLIPSLFPFLVCSNLLISLGAAETASRFADKIMMPLFKIRGCGSIGLILGLLSGYPCGAASSCALYQSGALTKNEAHRLLAFANNSGPLFIISAVGLGIYQSSRAGLLLYASHVLAALSVGIFMRFFAKPEKEILKNASAKHFPASAAVPESVASMLNLCGYVVFFAVLTAVLKKLGITAAAEKFLCFIGVSESTAALLSSGIFEITTALSSAKCTYLPAVSAIISTGGISVLFQTMSCTKKCSLSVKPYIAGKTLAGGFSAFYTKILLYFFPIDISVFSPSVNQRIALYTPYLLSFVSAAAIFVCFYLYIISKRLQGGKSACPEKQNFARTRS